MRRALAICALLAVAACAGRSSGGVLPATPAAPVQRPLGDLDAGLTPANGYYPMTSGYAARPLCPPAPWIEFRCFGWMRTDLVPVVRGNAIPYGVGYTPAEIQSAYGLNPKAGKGQTVAVVDAFGYTKAASDLSTYRKAAGLPACTTGNGCLRVLNQNGQASPLPKQPPASDTTDFGWVYEQSLDLDAVSAACPLCRITLIQTNDSNSLFTGVATAMRLSRIVSMSFGAPEAGASANSGWPSSGYALVASAGDNGGGTRGNGGPEVPCVWTAVVCAGGTRLTHTSAGSGCSKVVPKPSWQHDKGCRMRSSVDVSADASVFTPLAVYNSNFATAANPSKWAGIGGTSLSAPLIASAFALAANAATRHGAMELWQKHNAIKDVVKGTNVYVPVTGPCASSVTYICAAGSGYDGPTGWGSPKGTSNF